jgi:hypothetical protein
MLKWFLLLAVTTVVLFYWFVVAFFSDNNFEWYTSQFVQEVTGAGTLIGIAAMIGIVAVSCYRWARRLLRR